MVERVIRKDGTSSYCLKRMNGQVVSKLKRDLDAMVDHLNIQIENPCAVLDQENAKRFLQGEAKEKYKFFLKATDLFSMKTKYQGVKATGDFIQKSVLDDERAKLMTLRAARDEAQQQVREAEEYGRLEELSRETKAQMMSAMIALKEREFDEQRDHLTTLQQSLVPLSQEEKELKDKTENSAVKLEKKTAAVADANGKIKEADARAKEAASALKAIRRPITSKESAIKDTKKRILVQKRKIQSAERQIERETRAYNSRNQTDASELDQLATSIKEAENFIREAEERKRERENQVAEYDDHEQAQRRLDSCRRQHRSATEDINRKKSERDRLKSQTQSRVAVFGDKIPAILQMIQENRRSFATMPIGPIGSYVELPDEFKEFGLALEVVLGGTLKSFLVENGRDKALLERIKKQLRCPKGQCPIIIKRRSTSGRYHNLKLPTGDLARRSIANIIRVKDDFVFNTLVDVTQMENKLVFHDRDSAERAIFSGSLGQQTMPINVSSAYVKNGDRTFIRNGNQAYEPNRRTKQSSLRADVASIVGDIERTLEHLISSREVLERDLKQLEREYNAATRNRQQFIRDTDRIDDEISQHRNSIVNLKEKLRRGQELSEGLDLSDYQMDIQDATDEIATLEETILRFKQEVAELSQGLDEAVEQVSLTQDAKEEAMAIYDGVHQDVEEVYKVHAETKARLLHKEKELIRVRNEAQELESEVESARNSIAQNIAKAEGVYGPRRPVNKSVEYYQKKYSDIQHRIQYERNKFDGMDIDDLKHDCETKNAKYKRKKAELVAFENNSKLIDEMVEERERNWVELRKNIASTASQKFNRTMEIRDFAGKLKFNHERETLEISVLRQEPGFTRSSTVKDMKSLSGGERSYAQTALLLALGDSLECPFRVMDEFDVFMDSVNRQLTLELLILAAKTDMSKQFIFITPNDLSTVTADPAVKIQKLQAPRANA